MPRLQEKMRKATTSLSESIRVYQESIRSPSESIRVYQRLSVYGSTSKMLGVNVREAQGDTGQVEAAVLLSA